MKTLAYSKIETVHNFSIDQDLRALWKVDTDRFLLALKLSSLMSV